VRTPAQAAVVAQHADAAIVASALIDKCFGAGVDAVLADVAALAAGMRTARTVAA
jgi:tryptophan synthase alpha subunit